MLLTELRVFKLNKLNRLLKIITTKQKMEKTLDTAIATYVFCENYKPKDAAVQKELDMLAERSLETLHSLYSRLHMHQDNYAIKWARIQSASPETQAVAARWLAKEHGLFDAKAYATDVMLNSGASMEDLVDQTAKYAA